MFDTMTLTKATGAVCGSLLVFLLGGWAAESIYSMGGHGEDHAQGYVIDTGEDDAAEEVEDTGPDLPALFAAADTGKGERVFNKCKACHVLEDGQNGVGPHLYDVVGRDVGAVEGFGYSGALGEVADVWTAGELFAFLENPAGYAPGTSMGFAGLGKPEDRANVIAYLDAADGSDDIEVAGADEAPAEEEAAEEAPAEEAVTEDAPAEEAPVEEAAAEDAPAEEAPAEEAAAEEAPVEEAAAEDASSEEAPVEQATADEAGGDAGFAAMVVAADPASGEKLFRRCAACHAVEPGKNKVGPSMHGVVGSEVASAEGFSYSDALMGIGGVWTADKLSAWLENPRGFAPGNKMGYPGLKDEQDRADMIAYLDTLDGETYVKAAAGEAPAKEVAVEEAPVEEAAAEDAPAEEAAAEDAPAEEAAAEDAPVEEAPAEQEAAAGEAGGESAFAAMVASADIDAGKKTFRRCVACHAVEPGQNKVGPSLHGVVGSEIASVEDFTYSDALKGLEGAWTVDKMSAWLENPRGFAPGNRMGYPGLKDEQDRANVIGYLQSVSN